MDWQLINEEDTSHGYREMVKAETEIEVIAELEKPLQTKCHV
jgi:hypothetical protein